LLETIGRRTRTDAIAPTRLTKGFDRIPSLYGSPEDLANVEPNSIGAFRFERIYFCSLALKEKTERAGFRVGHGDVIYPGVPTEIYFGEVKPENAPLKKLLFVSHLNSESGAMTALEALREVRSSGERVTLAIYGRGESDYVAQLRSFAVTNQLPVEFLNVSDQNRDLAAIYRQHDAFLHAAEWDEPFSTRPLEAMACGLSVICSRIGGVREFLRERENSLSYAAGNPAELAARISELCRQPSLRFQIAQAGQAEVLQKFNAATIMDQIENYLVDSQTSWRGE
jgi:glycosyltransferase involved in cell wall biosynthesis